MSILLMSIERNKGFGMDRVEFSVNGRMYAYDVDGTLANKIDEVAKHKPGKALNIAKKNGELVEQKKEWIK